MSYDILKEKIQNNYSELFGIDKDVLSFCNEILAGLEKRFKDIDTVAEYNQMKVLNAMQKNNTAEMHLHGSTGYGYDDEGRDNLERIYADIFHTEDALVRPQIAC